MAKKVSKQARKKAAARKSRTAKKARRAPAKRPRKSARAKRAKHAKRPPAKAGSAFQLMIETINETERLRAKNERRDVTDETG